MSIDVRGQVVRLDLGGFESLVGSGGTGDEPAWDVPGVPQAIGAVRDPVVQLNLDVAGKTVVQTHRVWVDHEMAAFLLAVHEGEHQLMAVPPDLLSAGLARVLRVGPRAVGTRESRPVDAEVLADLFHGDELRRTSAHTELGSELAWHLVLLWSGGERLVSVVDGPEGAWLVTGEGDDLVLEPTDGTQLWRTLTTLLAGVTD